MGSLTIHLECTAGWERGKKLLATKGVETAFLLNANPEQIQFALDNTTGIVVVRVFDPFNEYQGGKYQDFEKDIILRHAPVKFVNWLNASDLSQFKGKKRVRFILGWNEMFYQGQSYQIAQNNAMIAVSAALITAGYGVALFGLASDKSIQWADVQAGAWDGVRDFLNKNKEWAHLDCHEYTIGRMPSQHLKSYSVSYPRSIEDAWSMRHENWGKIDYSVQGTGNYHLGRIGWILTRGKFTYARGEMGTDYKADGSLQGYIPDYMRRYVKPQGFPSLRELYNHLMNKQLNDTEFCEEIYKDLSWFVSHDPDCLSNAIFADNQGRDHAPFNIGQDAYTHLYKLLGEQKPMAEAQATIPFPSKDDSAWVAGKIRTLGDMKNARSQPSTSGTIITKLTGVYDVLRYPTAVNADGYEWQAYQVMDMNILRNVWLASSVVEFTPNPVIPQEPQYVVDILGATVTGNALFMDAQATVYETIADAFRNAKLIGG